EAALAGADGPGFRRQGGPELEAEGAAMAPAAKGGHFFRLDGMTSKSAIFGIAFIAANRSAGGAISLRAARSSQPPSLRTRAATLPSPVRISLTSRNREPSGA